MINMVWYRFYSRICAGVLQVDQNGPWEKRCLIIRIKGPSPAGIRSRTLSVPDNYAVTAVPLLEWTSIVYPVLP